MSTLTTTNLQHASAASPAIVLASDGTAAAQVSSLNDGPLAGTRNRIINGNMSVWQRGPTFTNAVHTTYTADRYIVTTNGINLTVTQDTDVPSAQFKYSLKAVPASSTTPAEAVIRQLIEQQNVYEFAGQSVTASAWVKCSKSQVHFRLGAQNATGGVDITQAVSVTAGIWTKISFTFSTYAAVTAWTATPTDSGGFLDIGFVGSTALTTADYIFITGVQLEAGTVATPFERRSYGDELALCQRYYYRVARGTLFPPVSFTTTERRSWFSFPVTMRATPTVSNLSVSNIPSPSVGASRDGVSISGTANSDVECSLNALLTSNTISAEL